MTYLRVVPAALSVWMALLNTGVSYAADRVALVCSGNVKDWLGYKDYGPEGIVVDLDRGVVIWGGDAIPIVKDTGESVTFNSLGKTGENVSAVPKRGSITKEGSLDRVTGEFQGDITASPEIASHPEDPESYYLLICKPAKPLF